MVVDGTVVAEYDGIVKKSLMFGSDGALRYFALRGDGLYRIEYVPKSRGSQYDVVRKAPSSADDRQPREVLTLLMGINQRTARAVHNSEGRAVAGMVGQGAMMIQEMREYGYTSESALFAGDWMLLNKTMVFTRDCTARGFLKSDGDRISGSMELTQPEAAVAFLMETFSPAERIAIQYEITSAKLPVPDKKRAALLREAGYDGDRQVRLKSHSKW